MKQHWEDAYRVVDTRVAEAHAAMDRARERSRLNRLDGPMPVLEGVRAHGPLRENIGDGTGHGENETWPAWGHNTRQRQEPRHPPVAAGLQAAETVRPTPGASWLGAQGSTTAALLSRFTPAVLPARFSTSALPM